MSKSKLHLSGLKIIIALIFLFSTISSLPPQEQQEKEKEKEKKLTQDITEQKSRDKATFLEQLEAEGEEYFIESLFQKTKELDQLKLEFAEFQERFGEVSIDIRDERENLRNSVKKLNDLVNRKSMELKNLTEEIEALKQRVKKLEKREVKNPN